MKKSLTPKTFYKIIGLCAILLISVVLVSNLSDGFNLVGYTINQLPEIQLEDNEAVVPCPVQFKNNACIRGEETKINFAPIFSIFYLKHNKLETSRMRWINQPSCVYKSYDGKNTYTLVGQMIDAATCRSEEKGFVCRKKI